jgi:5-formyltetrahydrofolate cyclo-ligase
MLAFDERGRRLGQGGGYYDRTLEKLRGEEPVFVLGLAFAAQEVEKLPAETHDQPLDAVLTEAGFRRFTKDS